MREMLSWLLAHRKDEPVVIIDDITRLARNLKAHIKLRETLEAVGAKLESPSIEFGDDSDSRLIENMLASVSQHHSQKNAEQVRHRMTARLNAGFFCFWAPKGYITLRAKAVAKFSNAMNRPSA
jgi:DNA invertase Pin-like site-specific DNA recombinase